MCGGLYPKFETPKQLLKINGEVIVERTIRLLRENGITDIAVSTNNPAFDYLNIELLHDANNNYVSWNESENKLSSHSWLNAYYQIEEPVCYLHGDVYFSDEAIKTIVNTKVKDTMFFCSPDKQDVPNKDIRNGKGREPLAFKVENYKLFYDAVKDLLRMVDDGVFKDKIAPFSWHVYRYLNGLDYILTDWGYMNNIFTTKGDYVVINDYTNDVDDIKDVAKIERYLKYEEGKMIRVEVIEDFSLGRFNELKDIQRRNLNTPGRLYKGDTFTCTEDLVDYLSGNNSLKRAFVKVIEVLPKKEPIKLEPEDVKIIAQEVNKAVKKTTKKKTSKK